MLAYLLAAGLTANSAAISPSSRRSGAGVGTIPRRRRHRTPRSPAPNLRSNAGWLLARLASPLQVIPAETGRPDWDSPLTAIYPWTGDAWVIHLLESFLVAGGGSTPGGGAMNECALAAIALLLLDHAAVPARLPAMVGTASSPGIAGAARPWGGTTGR